MQAILFTLCVTLAATSAYVVIAPNQKEVHLLGADKCTWGPGYWCQNITNSAQCHSTQHCIKKEWEKMTVPEDHNSVCDICKDMVKQARDQLQSNQTQEDLKSVFEGSCKLMIIKPVVKECQKLADEFIPELVETLASQMDPSVVCSVSGLCNSPRIDQFIAEYEKAQKNMNGKLMVPLKNDEVEPNECSKCRSIAAHMESKFQATSRDQFVNNLLNFCGNMGSFSDACSNIILVNFEAIYKHLQENFKTKNICHLSGQCSSIYHQHDDDETNEGPKVEIRPMSSVGMVEVDDDLPCKLCEQLVGHLRDLLVANTTEHEFQQILEGLCRQTKSFAPECMNIVDQYYPEIYEYLVSGLNSNLVCEMGGICPSPDKIKLGGPIMPLLPAKSVEIGVRIIQDAEKQKKKNLGQNGAGIRKYPKTEADEMQLPINRFGDSESVLGMPHMDVEGQKTCEFCEYLLHYLQQVITVPSTEEDLKNILGKVCSKLPNSVEGTCQEFVDQYGDALVAILAQEIDPSTVCPMLQLCPTDTITSIWQQLPKEKMIEVEIKEKPSCPFCLLAVQQVYDVIKNNKTEANIVDELDKLCTHLPQSLTEQCNDFVQTYSKELIEMLLADLTPQEVCVYFKLCNENKSIMPANFFPLDKDGEILTNEIPDFPASFRKPVKEEVKCTICQTVMTYVEKEMKNKSTKNEIENFIHAVCNYIPKYKEKCNRFVDEYGELVIQLLSDEISPREVCTIIGLCDEKYQQVIDSVSECALCEAILSYINTKLNDPTIDKKIEDIVSTYACEFIPPAKHSKCVMMMEVYEQSIINLLKSHENPSKICGRLALCSKADFVVMSHKATSQRHVIS